MADSDGAVQCLLRRIADLAIYEENLLVNLNIKLVMVWMDSFLEPYPGIVRDGENSWGKRRSGNFGSKRSIDRWCAHALRRRIVSLVLWLLISLDTVQNRSEGAI